MKGPFTFGSLPQRISLVTCPDCCHFQSWRTLNWPSPPKYHRAHQNSHEMPWPVLHPSLQSSSGSAVIGMCGMLHCLARDKTLSSALFQIGSQKEEWIFINVLIIALLTADTLYIRILPRLRIMLFVMLMSYVWMVFRWWNRPFQFAEDILSRAPVLKCPPSC